MIVAAEVTYKSGAVCTFHVHEYIPVIELAKLITIKNDRVKAVELRDGNGRSYVN